MAGACASSSRSSSPDDLIAPASGPALRRQVSRNGSLMRVSAAAADQNSMAAAQAASHVARCAGNGSAGAKSRAGTSPPGSGANIIGSMSYVGARRSGSPTRKLRLPRCMSVFAIRRPYHHR
jgi:hypothetical protein